MDLKSLLGKKKALEPDMKDTKLKVLKDMRKVASDAMGEDIKGSMAKATVIGKTPEDLEKGLDKAKEIVGEEVESEDESPDLAEMLGEEEDSEENEGDELLEECDTPEKIDEMIKKLSEKKQALQS